MATLPKSLRYTVALGSLVFLLVSIVATLAAAYSYLRVLIAAVPDVSPIAILTDPLFWVFAIPLTVLTVAYGELVWGAIKSGFRWCINVADNAIGPIVTEVAVEGIVRADSVAWRFEYGTDGEVSPIGPRCPQCGAKLREAILPSNVVHGSKTGFRPNQDWKDTELEVWDSTYGAPKTESTSEELGLACDLCRFSFPAAQSEKVGRESARKTFERHIDRMKIGNPRSDPFEEYKRIVAKEDRVDKEEASPLSVWCAYASTQENPELMQFDAPVNQ